MRETARMHIILMLAVFVQLLLLTVDFSWAATPRVEAGGNHTVALRTDGTLWAWGDNTFGQLGVGSVIARNSPVRIGVDTDWASISAGFYHTIALKSDGSLWAFGDNTKGQLGNGLAAFSQPAPVRIGIDKNWAAVAAGDFHSIALKTDGSLWGWGDNTSGQVGTGSVMPDTQPLPVRIGTAADWIAIAAGGSHSVALKADHTLWGWGSNAAGQLGNGTNIYATAPVQIVLPPPFINSDWAAVTAGQSHTVAVKTGGTLRAWGNNTFGQFGVGTKLDSDVPVQEIGLATNWAAATAGDSQSLGRKSDATIWAWGGNQSGQLGIGSNVDAPAPVKVGADTDWADVSSGSAHSVALKTSGTIWSWGDNALGQVGDGTIISRNAPVLVAQARFLPKGDLNQNAAVDITDALKALRITVGLIQPTADDMITGDVAPLLNGVPVPDGEINITDALLILRRVVGLIIF